MGRRNWHRLGLCCTNPVRESSCDSSVVAVLHEQTHTARLEDQELARLSSHCGAIGSGPMAREALKRRGSLTIHWPVGDCPQSP